MKLTPVFNYIKNTLAENTSFKLITWYNNQDTEGIIHAMPAVFIQFPEPMDIQQLHGQIQQAPLTFSVFLLSKVLSLPD